MEYVSIVVLKKIYHYWTYALSRSPSSALPSPVLVGRVPLVK